MTLLNLTVTPAAAWLSTDTAIVDGTGYDMPDGATGSGAELGPPTDRPLPPLLGHDSKLLVLPRSRAAAAAAGYLRTTMRWQDALRERDGEAFDTLAEEAPYILAGIGDGGAPAARIMAVLTGWSDREARGLAYVYTSGQGYLPMRLDGGHSYHPALATDDPDWPELCRLWTESVEGREVEAFHSALASNQMRAYRQGRYPAGFGAGGELCMARVGREGVVSGVVGELGV